MNERARVKLLEGGKFSCIDPSREKLAGMLLSIDFPPYSFFMLEVSETYFMQGARTTSGFIVEYQDGSPDSHYVAEERLDIENTLDILDAYVRQDVVWKEMCEWEPLQD